MSAAERQVSLITSATPSVADALKPHSFPVLQRAYTDIAQTVRDAGLLKRAQWFYALVGAGLVVALAGTVTGMILLGDSWFQLLMALSLGIIFTQAAFLAHEAAHRQILASGPANDRLALILGTGVVGISLSWWSTKHTRHHANPNKADRDPDIDPDTILFLREDAVKTKGLQRWITQRQGWLFFPLLTLEGFNLHRLSYIHLFSRGEVNRRWTELTMITLRLGLYAAAIFLLLPVGMAFAFIGVQLAVFGVYMGASFAPNHKGMPIIPWDAKLDFFSKQVRTSRNVSGGWWATSFMGGLNYQVEHHLFPSMPRPYLAKARVIVREHCETLDVPYTETTLLQSWAIVIAYLNEVGLAAGGDPLECHMVAQFRGV